MTWVERLARAMERVVPDAITTSILLMLVPMFALSLVARRRRHGDDGRLLSRAVEPARRSRCR